MLTATAQPYSANARNFALRGVAWSLGLFGLLRLGWVETHAVLPLTLLQARVAQGGFGKPVLPIEVTLACSGADALALSVGAILAYPATWRARLGGAAGAVAFILALNIVRIGTLGRAAGSAWFEPLHVYLWPGVLTLAIAVYVFSWMRFADTETNKVVWLSRRRQRFAVLCGAFFVLFIGASPFYLESTAVLAAASFVARAAAFALSQLGVQAVASANVVWTSRGGFLVTQECISTPLIPVYLAAGVVYAPSWRWRAMALAAAIPLFVGLGIARLLVVALPPALVGSPLFLIHAFYQLLLAVVVVFVAAFWCHSSRSTAWRRAVLGVALGSVIVYLLSSAYTRDLVSILAASAPINDPQGAIALLPSFQVGLYVALCVAAFVALAWQRFVTGLAILGLSQIAVFAALHLVAQYSGFTPHVRDIRAWTLGAPLLLVFAMVTYDRPRR